MSADKTGGAAFPVKAEPYSRDDEHGMTLRDYFAAKAMQAHIADMRGLPPSHEWKLDAAQLAYKMADAMLEVRK
jgi:hypothetical protein